MLSNLLDIARIILVFIAFFIGYMLGFGATYDPFIQLHITIPILIFAVAGISGIEGLFFGKQAARAKGYEESSNYQRQSAMAMLSMSIVAIIVCFARWGFYAEISVLFTFLIFFTLSGINHAREAILHKNYKWQNVNRPVITMMIIAGLIYPLVMGFRMIK